MPGPSPVIEHSLFEPITTAEQVTTVESLSAGGVARGAAGTISAEHGLLALDGTWRRYATDSTSEEFADPEFPDGSWPYVHVPNCYGSEPGLSRHFGPVWYRRRIALPVARENPHGGTYLEFTSVDYECDVFLDGEFLGHHEGYFAPFLFDVSEKAQAGSLLAVRVTCPLEPLDPDEYLVFHRKRQIKGILACHDSRPGGLPGKATPGWTAELGQSRPTGGITGPVVVRRTGPVRLDAVFVTPIGSDGHIQICVIASNRSAEGLEARIYFEVEARNSGGSHTGAAAVSLRPGPNRLDLVTNVPDAAVWQPPTDDGPARPPNYTITTTVTAGDAVSDLTRSDFGIRDFSVNEVSAEHWEFRINQRPIQVRGANYVPVQHFAGIDQDWYRRDFDLLTDLNVNSIGVLAHCQPGPFYEAADKAGFLVFQDFSLQWNYESDAKSNPGFREIAARMIAEMAYLLWNHPSVVYWCCHNEPSYVWAPEQPADPEADLDNQILDELLESRLRSVDPIRHVHRSSGIGDAHRYEGSLSGGALGDFQSRQSGFVTEYGFPAPAWSAARWGDAGWPPAAEALTQWASRLSSFGTTSTYVGSPQRYACPQDWIYACQRYGAFLVKYQTEVMRSWQSLGGYRIHFFCDWWGYAGAGLVDAERSRKLGFNWFRDANRPVIAFATYPRTVVHAGDSVSIPVWVASDRLRDTNALMLSWRLCQMSDTEIIVAEPDAASLGGTGIAAPDGHMVALPRGGHVISEVDSGRFYAPVEAGSSVMAGEISFTTPDVQGPQGYSIYFEWENPLGETGQNWFHLAVVPRDWTMAPGLWPVPRFDLEVACAPSGSQRSVRLARRYRPLDGVINAVTGEGGVASFTGLPPDSYLIRAQGADKPAFVELWRDSRIELDR